MRRGARRALRLAIALGLLLASANACAVDLITAVTEHLVAAPVLRGQFEQSKQVAGFKKPLVSEGDFLIARDEGVIWRTRSPFPGELRLTRDSISASQNGAVTFHLDANAEPGVRLINGLLFALLEGQMKVLGEQFEIDGEIHGTNWQLLLTPRDAQLARLMRRIELSGDQFVRHIEIAEANGDRTSIRLSAQSSDPAALTAAEVARFAN